MSSDNPSKWYEKTNRSFFDEIKNHVIRKRYIYETLLETNETENVLEIMKKAHARWNIDIAEAYKQRISPLTSFNDYKQAMKKAFESMQRNHIVYSIKVDSDEKLGFNVTKCIYSEVCKELNSTELGYAIFCHGDYDYAKTLHPKGRLVRNRTLMQGDAYCDHTFIWEDE
ncbi:hypothetical protein GTO27_10585 [Candidatus Bathyarchaeota archaeon]|nr:hypothetical protein [Candidatus Bathyarchaeota archaeon]